MTRIWAFVKKVGSIIKWIFTGSKLRLFLIGIMIGQWIMYPIVQIYKNTPVVHAILIPEYEYDFVTPREYVMNQVRNARGDQTVLVVHIASLSKIHEEYARRSGEEINLHLLGFYDYQEHDIWTIDSTDILVHEMRHIFEKGFHRSLDEIKQNGRFKLFYGF